MRRFCLSALIALCVLCFAGYAVPDQRLFMWLAALGLVIFVLIPPALAQIVERSMNKTRGKKKYYSVRGEAAALHSRLFIVDLHADTLLWNRNILARHGYGHVDLPRLVEGNVAMQVFGVVTKVPAGQNFESNRADSGDLLVPLTILQGWPIRAWKSPLQRALYQAKKLEWFAANARGRQFVLIRNQQDIDELLERREQNPVIVGGFPALEGAHALEGRVANVDLLYDAGFRMFGLSHFFDNEACGSAHGVEKGGLTPFGKEVVHRVMAKNMILDLAHASEQTIDDVLDITDKVPVVVSHTGVRGTCDHQRNLKDDHIKRIAAYGGVIGIAVFDTAIGETSVEAAAKAMRYTADLAGVDCVAFGSDFDGTVVTPIDASGLVQLTDALMSQGFSEEDIYKIMGGNFLRICRAVLPKA